MCSFYRILMIVSALVINPLNLQAKVQIFACEPEWASLAQELGGDKVVVYSATTAMQDPHHIRAKPSLIAKMRKSDLVIGSGASLEIGWLPVLLRKAGNKAMTPGSVGFLMAAEVVPLLAKTGVVDRSHGDIHPEGNPHVHLDPSNVSLVAGELTKRLVIIDPGNQAFFQSRYKEFSQRWSTAMARWNQVAGPLKGKAVVVHHTSFTYLENWLGLTRIATLEPKPGLPPTTAYLESLLQTLRANPAKVIVRAPYNSDKASTWLSKKTGIPALELPYTVGADNHCRDLFALYDRTLELLREATDGEQ